MKKALFLFLLALLSLSLFSQSKSAKKGVGYGYHSYGDMAALSEGLSWWYNWYHQPDAGVFSAYQSLGMEFVPMAWNGAFNETAMRAYLDGHPDVKYLLGFNEPNFVSQANMTPAQAAAIWPTLESIAQDYDLKLVAPAVNYCDVCVDIPGTTNDNDPTAWLDAFFDACTGCQVDYIAIHWYACTVGALEWYVGLFDKYELPVWITEIACWEGTPTLNDQIGYLIGAVDFMEQDPRVFRYAWFSGRSNGPYNSLLAAQSGVLTPLGELYVNFNPVHDTTLYVKVPARIEAENYARMNGILIEATADVDGFANIGWTDVGDWLEYNIDVPASGEYPFKLRAAGTNAGLVEVLIDGVSVLDMAIPSSGGWQNWTTLSSALYLPQGLHKIRLYVKDAGFNLNWLQIGADEQVATKDLPRADLPQVFPQPFSENPLYIRFDRDLNEAVLLELFDTTGRMVFREEKTVSSDTLQAYLPEYLLGAGGFYILKIQTHEGVYASKIIFQGIY